MTGILRDPEVRPAVAWRAEASLGEGPLWFPEERVLRFVDIKRGRLHRFDPSTATGTTIDLGGQPSFVVPVAGGGVMFGSEHALYRLQEGRAPERIATVAQPPGNRINDATVDSAGRLWFGTMDDAERKPTGRIWCFDRGKLRCAGGSAVVTNGPAVSTDRRILYHVDSGARTIWQSRLRDDGGLEPGEVFVRLDEREGYPDGVVLDAEGCLWVALWDGWGVRRYSPGGQLLLEVALPCARITKIAFGGDGLRTIFATSARVGLSADALAAQPLAGSLFSFAAPVAGLPSPQVRL